MTLNENDLNALLSSWERLNEHINVLTESELAALLERETMQRKRRNFLVRIHARLCRARTERERAELLTVCE